MSDKIREEFEERYPLPDTCEGFNGGFYFRTDPRSGKELRHPHQEKWRIWQASREALVVELPQRYEVYDIDGIVDREDGPVVYVSDICAAIEAQGLKVKP